MTDPKPRADAVPDLERAVQAARLDMVFGGQPMTLTVSAALAAIVVGVLWRQSAPAHLYPWLCVLLATCIVRGVVYVRYRPERKRGETSLDRWERYFEIGCLAGGSIWGSSALLLFPEDFVSQGFLAFVLAGVSSGAMAELAVAPRMARAFIIPCVAPLALRCFAEGDPVHVAMGVMAVMYTALVTFSMRRAHTQLRRTVAAQLDASATRRELSETEQRVDTMKVEFFSVVSHELRTPLTALRGALGLLSHEAGTQLSDRQRQMLDLANRNTDRLAVLIDDLLDIQRIESGGLVLALTELPVRPLLDRAIAAAMPYAVSHGIEISLRAPSSDAYVVTDSERFLQVMSNLLTNAVKFSDGGKSVDVTLSRTGGLARVEVRDFGPGIPKSMQPYIFSKFCQGDASDARRRGGTGLGLAISKALIEQMGGTIGYETREGYGTSFFFELPLCQTRSRHAP